MPYSHDDFSGPMTSIARFQAIGPQQARFAQPFARGFGVTDFMGESLAQEAFSEKAG